MYKKIKRFIGVAIGMGIVIGALACASPPEPEPTPDIHAMISAAIDAAFPMPTPIIPLMPTPTILLIPTSTPMPTSTVTADEPTSTPPTININTQRQRAGEITTSLGQRVHVDVLDFNDSPMRFDQLVRTINEVERLLGIPYPAPAVTMQQVINVDGGFCGSNQMSYAARYVDDPYVVENSIIEMRVDTKCNKTFSTIAHEVAHTWFHGNRPNNWINEGLANTIEYQLLETHQPDQTTYPPITYCQTYRNISELESAPPGRVYEDQHTGFSCNYSLGDGIMDALRQHHGDHEFNSRISQLARQKEASSKRAYGINDIRETLGDTSPALTIVDRWYQGNPPMRRYHHLDAIEWISPPIIDGQYLHFAGRIDPEGTIFKPINNKDPYCSQFVLLDGVDGTDYVANLVNPLAAGWKYDEPPKAIIISESIDSTTGYFEATAKLNDHSIAGRHNLTLLIKSRVTPRGDGQCKIGINYAHIEVE